MISSKQNVLCLYRRCLKIAQQITDLSQRATYLNYVKEGFRRKARLPQNSREALAAYRDGIDQVTDMEYYQSMARQSQRGVTNKLNLHEAMRQEKHAPSRTETDKDSISLQPTRTEEVMDWLTSQLPHLRSEDAAKYCECLVDDGFDSVEFIEEELLEEDLDFMKRAHKRVLMRHLEKLRQNTT